MANNPATSFVQPTILTSPNQTTYQYIHLLSTEIPGDEVG
jgi:hypothetical protein